MNLSYKQSVIVVSIVCAIMLIAVSASPVLAQEEATDSAADDEDGPLERFVEFVINVISDNMLDSSGDSLGDEVDLQDVPAIVEVATVGSSASEETLVQPTVDEDALEAAEENQQVRQAVREDGDIPNELLTGDEETQRELLQDPETRQAIRENDQIRRAVLTDPDFRQELLDSDNEDGTDS